MKKLRLITNPELFQGEKYLNKNKNYFEGWYFKHTSDKLNISFIPGISINKKIKKAFIQIITNNASYNVDYNIEDFTYSNKPFYIKIGKNYFSKEKTLFLKQTSYIYFKIIFVTLFFFFSSSFL